MANPRKFSEKIALHHQKQAEETAAFEQIMREVSDATSKASKSLAPARGPLRAGSLPDVSQVPPATKSEPPKPKPEEPVLNPYGMNNASPQSQNAQPPQQQTRGRLTGVGPMRARPQDRKKDTSPYGSTVYLSPPLDSGWRRTNSDSALHQSSTTQREVPGGSPHRQHYGSNYYPQVNDHGNNQMNTLNNQLGQLQQHHPLSHSHQGLNMGYHHGGHHKPDGNMDGMLTILDGNPNRPRSSCEVPRVPGINIYPSAHDNSIQIPVASNTGSLPDLTSVHLDRDIQDHSSSPYSTSPISASPVALSPTSVPPVRSTHSPHHSPRSTPQTGSPTAPHHHYSNHHTPQNHLSVPISNRYLHHSKGVTLESTWGTYQQQCSPPSLHSSHSNINMPSPTMGVAPSQISGVSNGGYRSPRSPGSSPGGAGGGGDSPHYDAGGGAATYTTSQPTAESIYINHTLPQHFEQFSMGDSPATSLTYIGGLNTNQSQFTQATLSGNDVGGGGTIWAGGGNCSAKAACIQAGRCVCGSGCLLGPHPNTPTTIPDIVLTDFSNTNPSSDLMNDLPSHFNEESSNNFDSLEFTDEVSFREDLDPIDLDGLEMLRNPAMIVMPDQTTEDAFRLDRL